MNAPAPGRPRPARALRVRRGGSPARAAALLLALGVAAAAAAAGRRPPTARTGETPLFPASAGPPAPVLGPEEALAAFRLAPGYTIELVAAEPQVQAPVAAAFDEDGRLWVVEMATYMPDADGRGELEPANRVVVLTDDDADGRMDRSAVFLDGLVLPRAVAPCFGGALVVEPPGLFFCRDTDGDGRADEKRQLLGGFAGRDNPEHAGNGLLRGLDNWYHLSQHTVEFRFDGEGVQTRPTPAHGQWGLAPDDAGRLYYTPNSEPLLADLFPKHYAARNAHQASVAGVGLAVAGAAAATWPARPTPGVNRGYLPGTLRPDGTLASLTAACGPWVCRSGALGPGARGDAFICEPAGMLVKRLALEERDGEPRGRNALDGAEFLASTDERFRPVNTCAGPDGALCIVDMHRGVIQHRTYLTPYLRAQATARGLERPLTAGRIYRVRAADAAPSPARRLSAAADAELVGLLSHPDGWWRDTAQRLLVERRAAGVAPDVRALAGAAPDPASRLHALWTLEGLGALTPRDALAAAQDPSPQVRAAGVRLAEPFLGEPAVLAVVRDRAGDADRSVRLQAACSLGEAPDPAASLVDVLRREAGDRVVRAAAISGLRGLEMAVLDALLFDPRWPASDADRSVLAELADCVLRSDAPARAALVDRAGAMALAQDARAGQVVARVRVALGLVGDRPRPLDLASEPRAWLAAAADPAHAASGMAESAAWFDWPGRPPVRRVHAPRALTPQERALFDRGRRLYAVCAVCHQHDGQGSPGLAPPLAASPLVEGSPDVLARVLLHGLEGPYEVRGQRFEAGLMPPAPLIGDEEFAAVMTYIRRSFGNVAPPVTPAAVKAARQWHLGRTRPWTRRELGVAP